MPAAGSTSKKALSAHSGQRPPAPFAVRGNFGGNFRGDIGKLREAEHPSRKLKAGRTLAGSL